jgi:alpha-1,2-mannosyltransferase
MGGRRRVFPPVLVSNVAAKAHDVYLRYSSNAGGGGERVLWAAVRATQKRWPKAICVVYSGDHDIDRPAMIERVNDRFGITLHAPTLVLLYLSTRHLVLASTYPRFTLLGQSLGSLALAYDAFSLLVPDIFIDTMGYAFTLAFCHYLFPAIPTAAYVHYPTISTDMLESLNDKNSERGLNAGAGMGWKGQTKKLYWRLFAQLYGWIGSRIDLVICNSTWTQGHISALWKPSGSTTSFAAVIWPPCAVEEMETKIDVSTASERKREKLVVYIAQFRPEKNHPLVLRAFAKYYHSTTDKAVSTERPKLVLIGSVRSNTSDDIHIYNLRLQARELKIEQATTFICDASFSVVLRQMQKASIGVNGMWNEHFGIGVVEYLAAGLIPVVHNSGGPKLDIVVPFNGKPTGYHAETDEQFATAFGFVFGMNDAERLEMRLRNREAAKRFTEEAFARKWIGRMEELVRMQIARVKA